MFIPAQRIGSQHQYYGITAIAVTAIIIAGFVPTYTRRLLHHDPHLTLFVQAHGLVMVSWIALFLIQTQLIAHRRTDLHRRLGALGAALIVAMPTTAIPVLLNAAARQAHGTHGAPFYLRLVAFDGVNLLLFVALAASAVMVRSRADYHKRLMLLATLSLLGPAFGRLIETVSEVPGGNDLVVLLLMLACLGACAAVDTIRLRRLHPVWIWAGLPLAAADVLTYIANTRL
ncbi:MAG TPA: hypothetical protein VGG63_07025 [Steroidobacteraceae bacterium]|jgi:hypothetical protein